MAPDDRDTKLDKALARHLRATSDSGARLVPATPDVCPDSEVLAAYHERSLLPEEMSSWKLHIAGCANCQAILAGLERTDDIPLGVPRERLAAAGPQVFAPKAAPVENSRKVIILRGARWKWLAPAGALAASLLLWIAWHEESRPALPKPASVEMAKVQEPPPPLQEAYRAAPASSSNARELKQDSSKPSGPAQSARADALSAAPAHKDFARARSSSASPQLSLDKKAGEQVAGADGKVSAMTQTVELQSAESARMESGAAGLKKEAELRDQQLNAQSQNLGQVAANAPKIAGPAPLNQAAPALAKEKATRLPAAPPSAAGYLDSAVPGALEVVSVSNPRQILAADGSSIWRAGRSGLIEFSSDNGKTWTRQFSGVLTDLLTGTAPSASTCWIVGRAGTLLVTTDGGSHWKLVKIPITEDLGGVRASDALRATIWNFRSTQYFQTSDGGQTWQPASAP